MSTPNAPPACGERVFRHSRSFVKVYSYPSGFATGITQISRVCSNESTRVFPAGGFARYVMRRSAKSAAAHSRA
jgi:hypothetical protein